MSGIVVQKEQIATDRPKPAVSEFDVASRGDEFHCEYWDGQMLKIDVSDLYCDPMLVTDLSLDSDRAMQSTAHI